VSESRQKSQEIDATRYGDEYRVPLKVGSNCVPSLKWIMSEG
jgi:hypothetical protein